ncbi:adenylylsulfate kinase-like kinase [Candidatus Methanoperedens nitroreducens]|uniref:Adenylylsulfate kinase-like kinase n=1 Tax=Candidatus Methanoperedens nitratireducens TaxID=1392998 RepID=A0A062V2R2_9EURY|nr:adenylyl-sulfate kinase [Candidatus Methanoperedens nitroreducens]KCZ70883.1 adenylylsulfate kinase-like kinase [Candidatus Methanoperedens nitroreducens]MDJ1421749.1 adenylyl-sulfate kinase [Candidatus Methanoperedens sp.]
MAFAVWFTGIPGSGKTVIAHRTSALLKRKGIDVRILQLDEIRRILTPHPRYTDEERDIVYASLGYMAKLLTECGMNVFIDATANRRKYRDTARKIIPQFAEVYIRCPIQVCMQREARRKAVFSPKDIYKKSARPGATVPGVNIPYEEPLRPEVVIDSDKMAPDEAAKKVADAIIALFGEINEHEHGN